MSQFLSQDDNAPEVKPAEVDFGSAVKLPGGGSTCDIYRMRWQRREVFVKRLKPEFRSKPLYLDALDKEFEVGVELHHPALPEYREFHRDYIVMDFVDGLTLAEMMRRHDPWLGDEKHVVTLLRELVGVVDYLHRHNVVHCDIKPDNVMITSNTKNLMLIDFDKSYTDALCDTSGHPGKYGLAADEVGRVAIDFHGIALVALRLEEAGFGFAGCKRFVRACHRPDANCEMLLKILDSSGAGHGKMAAYIGGGMIAIGLLAALTAYLIDRHRSPEATPTVTLQDSASMAPVATPDSSNILIPPVVSPAITPEPLPSTEGNERRNASDTIPITQEERINAARARAAQLDKRIKPYFDELHKRYDRLLQLRSNPALTGQQMLDSIRRVIDLEDEYISEAFAILNDMYPSISERDAWLTMSRSEVYTTFTRRRTKEGREYRQEYERRFAGEGTTPR